MRIILSIKPEFVKEIFEGSKRYEYRKSIFTKNVDKVLIYSTSPVSKIVGEFAIQEIIINTPEKLWEITHKESGISKNFFDNYFKGRLRGYALKIESLKLYKQPIDPFNIIQSFVAPQSFRYINEDEILKWEQKLLIS